MHGEATRQTSVFNFSAAVTTQGAAASSQGNSITPAWGALTSWRKNYTFGQAEKSVWERAFPKHCPCFGSRRRFRGRLSEPSSLPSPVTLKFWRRQGLWEGGSRWNRSVLVRCYVSCPVCGSHYCLRPEYSNLGVFPEEFRTLSFRSTFLSVSQRDFEDLPGDANMLICAGHILKCYKRSHDGLGLRPKPCSWYLRCRSLAQQACPVLHVTFIPNCLPFPLASTVCGQYSFCFVCDSMFFTSLYPLIHDEMYLY